MISPENISYVIPDNFPECKDCQHLKNFQKNNETTLTTNSFFSSTRFVDLIIRCSRIGTDPKNIMVKLSQEGKYFISKEKNYPLPIRYEESQFSFECPVLRAKRGLTNPK